MNVDEIIERDGGNLTVYETTGERDEQGKWKRTVGQDYTIFGVFLNATPAKLKLLGAGEVSEGGGVIQTQSTLYFQDPLVSNVEGRQTFLKKGSYLYRVTGIADHDINANYNTYFLERYQAHGSDS